ncbi:MAG: DUF4981 domain-containing protein, partial [Kangiellaceae bacterium]|nr:DUF4981 domain-containing protein [Kangiellaceae bacterium]
NLQGGHIWDWVDQSLAFVNNKGQRYWAYGHDYNPDLPTDGNFLNNGLVDPDRNPHPHLTEVKKVYQPVYIRAQNLAEGKFEVENRYDFIGLEHLLFQWKITENGKIIKQAVIEKFNVDAGKTKPLLIKIPKIKTIKGARYFLEFELLQNSDAPLLPIGHLVAKEQFELAWFTPKDNLDTDRIGELSLTQSDRVINIQGADFTFKFDLNTGQFTSMLYSEKELIDGNVRGNFWRPPTDNDLGNQMPIWAKVWRDASFNSQLLKSTFKPLSNRKVMFRSDYSLPGVKGKYSTTYTIFANGWIQVDAAIKLDKNQKLPVMPRFGMQWQLNKNFKYINWFGRGPGENYADRKSGSFVGHYQADIHQDFHRYSRPQETANKSDVFWYAISDKDGHGIFIESANKKLSFSAWPFAEQELDFASDKGAQESASGLVPVTSKHGAEIETGALTTLNIDMAQMGVGGDTSWGRMVHKQYQIPASPMNYQYWIKPFENKQEMESLKSVFIE